MMIGDRTPHGTLERSVAADAGQLPSIAYFLIVHGSRNSLYNAAIDRLTTWVDRHLTRANLNKNTMPLVDVGFLELHQDPLHAQIVTFSDRAQQQGINRIHILPLFLLPGVHTIEDIPEEVAIAQTMISSNIALDLLPYLGTQRAELSRILMSQMPAANRSDPTAVWILFSHGSRRAGGNESVEAIAHQLAHLSQVEVVTAYSFIPPFLSDRVAQLWRTGYRRITILPYVLFPGELTQAIDRTVTELYQTLADLQFNIAKPIGATADLAQFIVSMLKH